MSNIYRDIEGRVIIIDLTHNCQIVTIVVVYAPNEDSPEFFGNIAKLLRSRQELKIIIGDFNLTLCVDKDRILFTTIIELEMRFWKL